MKLIVENFVAEETGAITVDWVVLSAGVVAMAIAATDVINGGLNALESNLEAQLRTQQISDAFVSFTPDHFDILYDLGIITEDQAEDLFNETNDMTNGEILTALETYIEKMVNGSISEEELEKAFAVASVAYQRNIVEDAVIENYFTYEGLGEVAPSQTM